MARIWVIDGYNLIHRGWPASSRGSLEDARRLLEARLASYQRATKDCELVLVYDGKSGYFPGRAGSPGLRVVFSRPPETADDKVLELCRRLEGEEEVGVVTSDFRDIASRVAGLRASHVTSEEFARRVERRLEPNPTDAGRATREKPRTVSERDTDEWLREFGMEEENGW